MGLSDQTTPDMADTISVVHGKWTKRVPEGTEGAKPRELTKGKNMGSTVWELGWSALRDMLLVDANIVKPEGFSSTQVELSVKDAETGEIYLLALPYDSKYLKTFVMTLPMLDPTVPFHLEFHMARTKTPTGDDKFNLRVVQFGKSLSTEHFLKWSKDPDGKASPQYFNGCPAPVQDELSSKWNFDEQNRFICGFLKEYMDGYSVPETPSAPPTTAVPPSPPASASAPTGPVAAADVPADFDEYEDDIPF